MPIEFTDTQSESVANGVKLMVYAPAGMGKTMLNATLPSPVLISAESGLLSLSPRNIQRVFGVDTPGISYNIPVIKIRNIQDLNDAYEWCVGSSEAAAFESVALDSITEIMEQILSAAKVAYKDPRQAYGELAVEGEKLIRSFRDIYGKNVYMSSKMAPFKDELANITKYGPMAPGSKLGPAIPYFFDELFSLRMAQDEEGHTYRYLQTQPDIQYEAKDRSGCLDAAEYPHLGAVIDKIRASGYVEGETEYEGDQQVAEYPADVGDYSTEG